MDWRHRAACRDEDPELFFPIGTKGPALLQVDEAKDVCRRCPVVVECLSWALDSDAEFGVWGAKTEDERRALKRERLAEVRGGEPWEDRLERVPPPHIAEVADALVVLAGNRRQALMIAYTLDDAGLLARTREAIEGCREALEPLAHQ